MNSAMSRAAERLARMRIKKERLQNPSQIVGQKTIPAAQNYALSQRIKSGRFGMLRPDDVEAEEIEEIPVPIDDLPQRMVSFIVQKQCSCGTINKLIATECRKCRGHFCYDKTVRLESPLRTE